MLKDAKVQPEKVDDIVLVGGSTRIPRVQELLQEHFKVGCETVIPPHALLIIAVVAGAGQGIVQEHQP